MIREDRFSFRLLGNAWVVISNVYECYCGVWFGRGEGLVGF